MRFGYSGERPLQTVWVGARMRADFTSSRRAVHIAAVGWIYVTLMMSITEETVVAGIMTFLLYGVLPTLIIIYVGGSPQRRKRNEQARLQMMQEQQNLAQQEPNRDPNKLN
ncbi:MAG: hypothetical protein ACKO6R_10170 [Burkholderiaceae bacterium]